VPLDMSVCEQDVFETLFPLRNSKTIILGIGNTLKGDDGLGPLVCKKLEGKINAELIDAGTVPENYIQSIIKKKPQALLIIDAADFNASPGTIKILKPERLDSFIASTHILSPRIFIDMICRSVEVNVYFIAVQPAQMDFGQQVSPNVDKAICLLEDVLTKIFST
jgi:hydrogenase 3 maturation protease